MSREGLTVERGISTGRTAGHKGLMPVSQVRRILSQYVNGEQVLDGALEAARFTIRSMCSEAAQHGITAAEVIRSVLRPVFERRSLCDCATCRSRRGAPPERVGYSRPWETGDNLEV